VTKKVNWPSPFCVEVEEKDVVLGMRSPKKRSLLDVNEHFEGKLFCWQKTLDTTLGEFLNDGLYFVVLPIDKIIH
jgi:hypothetical protein